MSDINMKRAHGMEIDKAKQMLDQVSNDVKAAFPKLVNDVTWNGDKTQANFKGKGFSGVFQVDATDISVAIDLSMFTRPFKGNVEKKITEWMDRYIK